MGTIDEPYELKGLSNEQSWSLFKALAFRKGDEVKRPGLAKIGEEIVKKCANVPLAIKTIASILYSRDTEKDWEYFRDKKIGLIDLKENDIMPTLMLSYDHLQPHQKRCFAYCALFPEDHLYDIQSLVWLWMANGFVESEADGGACFMELWRRCLFQDVEWDKHHVVLRRCRMHDLIHDMAQTVAEECLSIEGRPREAIDHDIRHVCVTNWECFNPPLSWLSKSSSMRSFLFPMCSLYSHLFDSIPVLPDICSSFLRLHVLDMDHGYFMDLQTCIGELQHLRYLKVMVGHPKLLQEITRLQFLQTLDLSGSSLDGGLPKDFCKLTSLRNLLFGFDFQDWDDMPPGFERLENLQTLDWFVVGEGTGLNALFKMDLTGELSIWFKKRRENAILEARMANLRRKKLTKLNLFFLDDEDGDEGSTTNSEAEELMECLRPSSTLKVLEIEGWRGVRFPDWGTNGVLNLVYLNIASCERCEQLPPFKGLPHLKTLIIEECPQLDLRDARDVEGDDGRVGRDVNEWQYLKSLTWLRLDGLQSLTSLPHGIRGLTMLQTLELLSLPSLESLPESIGQLTQLKSIKIFACPVLQALPKSFKNLLRLQTLRISNDCWMLAIDEDLGRFFQSIGCSCRFWGDIDLD